jgi:hypothetical protein
LEGTRLNTEESLLKELAKLHHYWVQTASQVLTDETADLIAFENEEGIRRLQAAIKEGGCEAEVQQFFAQIAGGLIHSILAGFDGSGELKENSGVSLVDEQGQPLVEYLHELWPEYYR